MTRDEFEELLDYGGMMPYLWSDRRELLLAEYDRLTALNAQLLEAMKQVDYVNGQYDEMYCPWCYGTIAFNDDGSFYIDHKDFCKKQAAIRAAEESK